MINFHPIIYFIYKTKENKKYKIIKIIDKYFKNCIMKINKQLKNIFVIYLFIYF